MHCVILDEEMRERLSFNQKTRKRKRFGMPINAEPEACEDHQDQGSVLPRGSSSYGRCVLQKEDGKEIRVIYASLDARRSRS